jgi:DnaJ-class molecular chaperone
MFDQKNYYDVLGIPKTATADEIKQAYRRLAHQHHPDKGGDTEKFQEIEEAYRTLGSAEKRAQYDNPNPFFGSGPGAGWSQASAHFNMDDIFSIFGQGAQRQRRNHVRMAMWITLTEAAQGVSKTLNVGTSMGSSTVQISVPKGIDNGDNVQYTGVAPGGLDLVVNFRIHPDPRWQRDGLNLYTEQKISVWDLILGTDIEVSTISGAKIVMRVPPNTQPGTTMRVRGHGMPNNQDQAGDCFVRLAAELPQTIAPEIVAAIQQHR